MKKKWGTRAIILLGLLLLFAALWPNADSLYNLTGEEGWKGQAAGMVHWGITAVRPQPQLAADASPSSPPSPFGMNTFLQQEVEPEKRERTLQLLNEANFGFIRQEFTWEDIEVHGKDDFIDRRNDPNGVDAWAKYDNIVQLAAGNEIEIIARLSNPPSWTRALTDTIGTNAPPDDFNDYGDFAAAVASRYADDIRYFQLWNEPNGNEEWGKQDVNPEAYTELLCIGYERIKAVNPDAVVLLGALTPTVAINGRNLNELIYLQRLYDAGAGDCFDVLSAQGYGLWSGATDQRLRSNVVNYPRHLFLRDMMVRNGDAHKPIWISEMGWNSVPDSIPANFGRVTQEQQAKYGVEAYQRAQAEWPWMGVMNYWFLKRAGDSEENQSWYYFRIMEPDFTPLPAYDALATYANEPPSPDIMAEWERGWMEKRPFFFITSISILFFALLHTLAPKNSQ